MNDIKRCFELQTILLPKAGSEKSECEDSIGTRSNTGRFCVADGATEAFDSRRWARLLTKHWVSAHRPMLTREQLSPWLCALGERFGAHWSKRSLPWYAEEKARSGAFAAFLGLILFESTDCWSWQAIAIGDACLIHTGAEGVVSFPISDPSQFGYHPFLAPSNGSRLDDAIDHVVVKDGLAKVGDVFLLLTDAIAAWYLESVHRNPDLAQSFNAVLAAGDAHDIEIFVNRCRNSGNLRNDDVAAIRIVIKGVVSNNSRSE
jgi:hypothetical protein